MAALVGGTLLTGSALTVGRGFNLSFTSALQLPVALHAGVQNCGAWPHNDPARRMHDEGLAGGGAGRLAGRGRKPSMALTAESELSSRGLGGVCCA